MSLHEHPLRERKAERPHNHPDPHAHCCQHRRTRFCAACRVTYCLDCGEEWRAWGTLPWPHPIPHPPIIWWGTTTNTTGLTRQVSHCSGHGHVSA